MLSVQRKGSFRKRVQGQCKREQSNRLMKAGRTSAKKQIGLIAEKIEESSNESETDQEKEKEEEIYFVDVKPEEEDEFLRPVQVRFDASKPVACWARVDTGCPVSLIKGSSVNSAFLEPARNGIGITV